MSVLVLDLDGVVVRGHPEGGRWDQHLERDLGIPPADLQARFFRPHFQRIVTGEADLLETLERLWPELGYPATPRALVDYWFAMDSDLDLEVLAEVGEWRGQGGQAYLATVQEHYRARYLMETLGLARHFNGMFYAAALGVAKPDPRFYERVQMRLPVASPGEVIFLDDSIKNVDAAAAFGWQASYFRSVTDLRAALGR